MRGMQSRMNHDLQHAPCSNEHHIRIDALGHAVGGHGNYMGAPDHHRSPIVTRALRDYMQISGHNSRATMLTARESNVPNSPRERGKPPFSPGHACNPACMESRLLCDACDPSAACMPPSHPVVPMERARMACMRAYTL